MNYSDAVKMGFVPYEPSLRLKALGFDEPCFATWSGETLDMSLQIPSDDYFTKAPTYSQAFVFQLLLKYIVSFFIGHVGPVGKVIEQYSLDNVLVHEFESICNAAKQLNISKSGIIRCCKGKQKKCGNFIFKYKEYENI